MASEARSLHILVFPLMAAGHMIPLVDLAKLFARRALKTSILITPANAALIQPTIDAFNASVLDHPIQLVLIPFPSVAVGLPDGCENASSILSMDMRSKFYSAIRMLCQPFEQVLRDLLPDAIVSDSMMPWTFDVASEIGIPRLVFHGTGFFPMCAWDVGREYKPHERDEDSFVLPGLPHRIQMLKSQFPNIEKTNPSFVDLMKEIREKDGKSYGLLVNSFYELEPDYSDHYRKVLGRRAWHIGPVSLCNEDIADKSQRGEKPSIEQDVCIDWLDSKRPNSVLYVCFGSLCRFTAPQLREIALGLEASNRAFIWVARKPAADGKEWLPEDYEKRIEGRGLVIRGWAPQLLILNHPATGGFVTHCGWNSMLEAVCGGVPMITWPMSAEQFFNERLIVDVLRIGVALGVKHFVSEEKGTEQVKAAELEKTVAMMMEGGKDVEEMRRRVAELKEMAKKATENGGSSDVDMDNLIRELTDRRDTVENHA